MTANNYNQEFTARGYKTLVLSGKEPQTKKWQAAETAPPDFIPEGMNVGVVLGDLSGGLVDIDIDSDDALPFADHYLPETPMSFGRGVRRRTHRLYKVSDAGRRKSITSPSGKTIIEVRGNGHQTMFPGSTHPTGESVTFDTDGQPAIATWSELVDACKKIAIGVVLVERWGEGSRHYTALAVAGLLRKAGWSSSEAEELIELVAKQVRDNDIDDRIRAVHDTYDDDLSQIAGYSALVRLIGEREAKQIAEWAGADDGSASLNSKAHGSRPSFDTDADCALAFATAKTGRLIYCRENEKWYRRELGVYDPLGIPDVQGEVVDFGKSIQSDGRVHPQDLKKVQGAPRIKSIIELSRHKLGVNFERLDNCDHLLGCRNGVLDLNTGTLSIAPEGYVTKRVAVSYDRNAECPKFMKFIRQTFGDDQETMAFVQRVLGYTLSGSTGEQCMFFLIGTGANGKSTLLEVFGRLLGDYDGVTPQQALMVQKYVNDRNDDLANLVGKRFVRASEGEAGAKLAVAKIKLMTGGDTIACRFLYGNQFRYRPQFKVVFATNDLPIIEETGEAIWRRIHVIRFPYQVPQDQRNGNLVNELVEEGSGILNWALAGYQDWIRRGLNPPQSVMNETASYRHENDTLKRFINDRCVLDTGEHTMTNHIYTEYELWCEGNGLIAMPVTKFGKELPRFGLTPKRTNKGSGWIGIRLQTSEEQLASLTFE